MVFAPVRAFGVTLTQASTGDARHEYFDGTGAAWVKGEEDDEFFIVLTNNDTRPALCKVYVDGVHLGYDNQLPAGATTPPLGVLKSGQSFAESNLITHALKFVKRTRDECAAGEDEDDHRLPSAGSVTVKWYNCIWDSDATYDPVHTTRSWQGTASSSSSATMHKKEQSQLRSEEGSAASSLSNSSTGLRARCGELLDTVTVQYTSDFGLAVRGLLTKEETGMSAAKRQKTCITID